MKVSELIQEFKEYDQNYEVAIFDFNTGTRITGDMYFYVNDGHVEIQVYRPRED